MLVLIHVCPISLYSQLPGGQVSLLTRERNYNLEPLSSLIDIGGGGSVPYVLIAIHSIQCKSFWHPIYFGNFVIDFFFFHFGKCLYVSKESNRLHIDTFHRHFSPKKNTKQNDG